MGKKNTKKTQTVKLNPGNIITGAYLIAMLLVFPVYYHQWYADILEARYGFFLAATAVYAGLLLLWGIFSKKLTGYFREAVRTNADENGKWFKNWFRKEFRITDRLMLLFFAVNLLSMLLASPYMYQAFYGNEGRDQGMIFIAVVTVMYFCVTRNMKFKQYYAELFAFSSLFICIFGITDFFGQDILGFKRYMSDPRQLDTFASTIGNINSYSNYVAMIIGFFGGLFIFQEKSVVYRICDYVVFAVAVLAIILSTSDNAYLAIAAFWAFLPVVALKTRNGLKRYLLTIATLLTAFRIAGGIAAKYGDAVWTLSGATRIIANFKYLTAAMIVLWALTIALYAYDILGKIPGKALLPKALRWIWLGLVIAGIAGVVGVILWSTGNPEAAKAAFGNMSEYLIFNDHWGTDRGCVWRCLMEEFGKLPLYRKMIGTGPETMGIYLINSRYEEIALTTHQFYDSAHNDYLQYLFNIGIVGLLTYLGLLIAFFKETLSYQPETWRPYVLGAAAAVLCFLFPIAVTVNVPIISPVFWLMIAIGIGICRKTSRGEL